MRASLAAFRIPKRRRAMRKQTHPDAVRLFYFAQLRALMAKAHALVTAELLPLVHSLRADATDEEQVRARARELARRFAPSVTPGKLARVAEQVGQRTADFQKAQLQAQIQDVLTVKPFIRDEGLAENMAEFTARNVSLIKSIPQQYFADVEQVVGDGVRAGQRATTIAKDIEERYDVSESRAALIANDQVGKFFGALNDTRQQELGITSAIWSTVHDQRVRHSHEELDGESYALGEGLIDEQTGERVLPGEAVNCRCQGMPDLDGLLGETA